MLERRDWLRRGIRDQVLVERKELSRALRAAGSHSKVEPLRRTLKLRIVRGRKRLRQGVMEPLDQLRIGVNLAGCCGSGTQRGTINRQLRMARDADFAANQPGH